MGRGGGGEDCAVLGVGCAERKSEVWGGWGTVHAFLLAVLGARHGEIVGLSGQHSGEDVFRCLAPVGIPWMSAPPASDEALSVNSGVGICVSGWHCVVIMFGVWGDLTVTEVVLHSVHTIVPMCLGKCSTREKERCSPSQW